MTMKREIAAINRGTQKIVKITQEIREMSMNIEQGNIGVMTVPVEDAAGWKPKPIPKRELKAGDWVKHKNGWLSLISEGGSTGLSLRWVGVHHELLGFSVVGSECDGTCAVDHDVISPREAALMIAPELKAELDRVTTHRDDAIEEISKLQEKARERALLLVNCGEEIGGLKQKIAALEKQLAELDAAKGKGVEEVEVREDMLHRSEPEKIVGDEGMYWKDGCWFLSHRNKAAMIKHWQQYPERYVVPSPTRKAEILAMGSNAKGSGT